MKRVILIMMMLAGVASGQTNEIDWGVLDVGSSITIATTFHMGNIILHMDTGEVEFPTNITPSDASMRFWNETQDHYGNKTRVVKTLAKQGEICKVYGHRWRAGFYDDLNPLVVHARKEGLEVCQICNATKTTKTVTEIKEAK